MTSDETDLPIIDQSSTYHVEERLIYDYDYESGLLKLDIGKNEFKELLANVSDSLETTSGASFCFFLPQMGEVCFTGVRQLERIDRGRGFIKRITRILRRNR